MSSEPAVPSWDPASKGPGGCGDGGAEVEMTKSFIGAAVDQLQIRSVS